MGFIALERTSYKVKGKTSVALPRKKNTPCKRVMTPYRLMGGYQLVGSTF
jgi:hypothetical protein